MSTTRTRASRAAVAAAMLFVFCACTGTAALSGEVVSTMRNVNAVPEANGFRLNPAFDLIAERGPDEVGEPQAFEILRPLDQGVTLGRIYTSCTCIQLVAHKRTFAPGERAVLHLRNVRETPVNGQIYAIYVQISAPIRTTLRFDTFVQSNSLINPDPDAPAADAEGEAEGEAEGADEDGDDETAAAAAADAGDENEETEDSPAAADAGDESEEALAAAIAEALTAEEMPEMPGIEIIVPGGAATAQAAGPAAQAEAQVAATEAAAQAEAAAAAAEAAAEAAREELAAIMRTRSEELTAPSPAAASATTAAVREEIDSFFAAGNAPAPRAPVATATATAAESGWQVVAAAPAATTPAAQAASAPVARPAAPAAGPAGSVRAVSLITLGVRDMSRSAAFYEAIGWRRAARSKYDAAAFFQLHGQVLALYPIADMLREQGMADARPAPGGIALALHVATPEEVVEEFDRFVAAGGVALREPIAGPAGAITGYVADPDGNPWEISCVPQFVLDGEGGLWLR